MSDHFSNIQQASFFAVLGITFSVGFLSSLHCIGMCGGLVTSCAPSIKSNFSYQMGRLFSYTLLGFSSGLIGHILHKLGSSNWATLISAFLIGGTLIFWGIRNLLGRPVEITPPLLIQKLYGKSLQKSFHGDKSILRAFSIGLFSIFLPCGLLYSVVLALAPLENPLLGSLSLATFWLGTTPALAFAPEVIKKILLPLSKNSPRLSSLILVAIGTVTILTRIYHVFGTGHHHHH